MAHMSSGFYRDRLGFDPDKEASAMSATSATSLSRQQQRTVTSSAYSSSSRQEVTSRESRGSASHYAVSSHVSNGNLVVDNGQGVIQQQTHGMYEENLSKFKGEQRTMSF